MRRTILTLATTTLVLLLAAPGHALHCNGDIITITTPAATLYIDDRSDETGEINHWLYLESNGIEGLQSGSDPFWQPDDCQLCLADPCYGHSYDYGALPDSMIL